MDIETYHIRVELWDKNGKVVIDKNGIKRPDFSLELSLDRDAKYSEGIEGAIKSHLTQIGKTISAWSSDDCEVEVTASVLSSITNTYMVLYTYRTQEDRFIKH
jgi:hypothetical protein